MIDIDENWNEPSILVIRQPTHYEPSKSRIVMHETLHWWQQLGLGFFTHLAAEDWQRLLEFESTGIIPDSGPFMQELLRFNDSLGFSAWNLIESLTRYWDVHICGPTQLLDIERIEKLGTDKEFWKKYDKLRESGILTIRRSNGDAYTAQAYNLAMEGVGGRYARPYKLTGEFLMNPDLAGVLFPIAAHFAFQTSKPTDYFERFVEILAPYALPPRSPETYAAPIEELWINLYYIGRELTAPVIYQAPGLYPLAEIRESGLINHPGYARVLKNMEHYATLAADGKIGKQIIESYPRMLEEFESKYEKKVARGLIGFLVLDLVLSTPGIPNHRAELFNLLPPPLIRFKDGKTWLFR